MVFSASNTSLWTAIIQFSIISCFLIIANILRRKIRFIDRSLLPVAVIAGFILLLLKEFNILSIDKTFMESLTYHCTAIGFIALGLRTPSSHAIKSGSSGAKSAGLKSGMLIVSTYLVQAVVGLSVTMLIAYLFMPDLFMASGLLLPLGFGQGPGQAYNIGTTYQSLGFVGGSSYGLAIASMGFIWAAFGGATYMVMLRKKGLKINARMQEPAKVTSEMIEEEDEVPLTEALDKFTIQIALIFIVYLATYLLSKGATSLLANATFLGNMANTISSLIWGFNFLIGSSLALLVNVILSKLKDFKVMHRQYRNNYMLNRISGLAFDIMITASISSIALADLKNLWIPFLLITTVGGIITILYLKFLCKRVYPEYPVEGFFSMYGMLTGTVSTGVMLLREIDPNFKTPAATNLVTGSSTAIILGFPLLLMVGLAPNSVSMLFIIIGICLVYGSILTYLLVRKKKGKPVDVG